MDDETLDSYRSYKLETQCLLQWITLESNNLIRSEAREAKRPPTGLITGQFTVVELVTMSERIAGRSVPVPDIVFRLFESVIKARNEVWETYHNLATFAPNPELEHGTRTHKYFINSLERVFLILGGSEWRESRSSDDEILEGDADLPRIFLESKFSALTVEGTEEGSSEEDNTPMPQEASAAHKSRSRAFSANGKKGRKGQKSKRQQKASRDGAIKDLSLEEYKILGDDQLGLDYLMAATWAMMAWNAHRLRMQHTWDGVMRRNLNSAVAGVLGTVATAMVRKSAQTMFIDYPGNDSYEKIITRFVPRFSYLENGNIAILPKDIPSTKQVVEGVMKTKEDLFIYAYESLLSFIKDYQVTRSGKPTKAMQAKLKHWKPDLGLKLATPEERLEWRRRFIILWLYDLVNFYASPITEAINKRGEDHVLEEVDWSRTGPCYKARRLYGLADFASEITGFAMQKPGTNVREQIWPHLVFQVQCIADSWAAWRGWIPVPSIKDHQHKHVLRDYPSEKELRGDLDYFMGGCENGNGGGLIEGFKTLDKLLWATKRWSGEKAMLGNAKETLNMVSSEFEHWLGGPSLTTEPPSGIPESVFPTEERNGLWNYSPYLCATGLMEGLEICYDIGLRLLDRLSEPLLIIHLHNMLVQRGYLKPYELLGRFERMFRKCFFANGEVPTSAFHRALTNRYTPSLQFIPVRTLDIKRRLSSEPNFHDIFVLESNRHFRQSSYLNLFRKADWDINKIPDKDVPVNSLLFLYRLSQCKMVKDRVTHEPRFKDETLIRRAIEGGLDANVLTKFVINVQRKQTRGISDSLLESLKEQYPEYPEKALRILQDGMGGKMIARHPLGLIEHDLTLDIAGPDAISGNEFPWMVNDCIGIFQVIEMTLGAAECPLYERIYKGPRTRNDTRNKRLELTLALLQSEDEELLKCVAQEFSNREKFQVPRVLRNWPLFNGANGQTLLGD